MEPPPPAKRKRTVRRFTSDHAMLVRAARDCLERDKDGSKQFPGKNRVWDRLEALFGLSPHSILTLLDKDDLPASGEPETRDSHVRMSDEDTALIRPAIVALVREKVTPTLDILLKKLHDDYPEWKWSRSSLYNALHRIGFSFNSKRYGYYDRLRENPDNIALRDGYLQQLFTYEVENRQILFMDESWINKNAVPSNCWTDGTRETVDAVPNGKGPRWIMIGCGGRDGWIQQSFVMWTGKSMHEDYHTDMNAAVFEDWLKTRVLPNVDSRAVIVMDRAPYHTVLTEESKGAQASWSRIQMAEWLVQRGWKHPVDGHVVTMQEIVENQCLLPGNDGNFTIHKYSKTFLYAECQAMKPPKKFKIYDWLDKWNGDHATDIKVLFLPVAHPQLNPIEMMWSWLKEHVKKNNHDFKMSTVKGLVLARQQQLNAEWWGKACSHASKFAMEYVEADEQLIAAEENEIADMNEPDSDNENTDDE